MTCTRVELCFWSSKDDVVLNPRDFSAFRWTDDRSSPLYSAKSLYLQRCRCGRESSRPERSCSSITRLQHVLSRGGRVCGGWRMRGGDDSSTLLWLLLSDGSVVMVSVCRHTARPHWFIVDSSLQRHLRPSSSTVVGGVWCGDRLVIVDSGGQLSVCRHVDVSMSSNSSKNDPASRNTRGVVFSHVLPVPASQRLSVLLDCHVTRHHHLLLAVGWPHCSDVIKPWLPLTSHYTAPSSSNLLLYRLTDNSQHDLDNSDYSDDSYCVGGGVEVIFGTCTEHKLVWLSFSANSDQLYILQQNCTDSQSMSVVLFVYSVESECRLCESVEVPVSTGLAQCVAVSRDASYMLVATNDAVLYVHHIKSGHTLTLRLNVCAVSAVWLTCELPLLLVLCSDGCLCLFDAALNRISLMSSSSTSSRSSVIKQQEDRGGDVCVDRYVRHDQMPSTSSYWQDCHLLLPHFSTSPSQESRECITPILSLASGCLVFVRLMLGCACLPVDQYILSVISTSEITTNSSRISCGLEAVVRLISVLEWKHSGSSFIVCFNAATNYLLSQNDFTQQAAQLMDCLLSRYFAVKTKCPSLAQYHHIIHNITVRYFCLLIRRGWLSRAADVAAIMKDRHMILSLLDQHTAGVCPCVVRRRMCRLLRRLDEHNTSSSSSVPSSCDDDTYTDCMSTAPSGGDPSSYTTTTTTTTSDSIKPTGIIRNHFDDKLPNSSGIPDVSSRDGHHMHMLKELVGDVDSGSFVKDMSSCHHSDVSQDRNDAISSWGCSVGDVEEVDGEHDDVGRSVPVVPSSVTRPAYIRTQMGGQCVVADGVVSGDSSQAAVMVVRRTAGSGGRERVCSAARAPLPLPRTIYLTQASTTSHPTSCSHPTSSLQSHPTSKSHPTTSKSHPTSNSHPSTLQSHPTSNSHPKTSYSHPKTSQSHPTTSLQSHSVSSHSHLTSKLHPTTSQSHSSTSKSHPTSQSHPTTSQSCPTSNSHPTTSQSHPTTSHSHSTSQSHQTTSKLHPTSHSHPKTSQIHPATPQSSSFLQCSLVCDQDNVVHYV